jgi:hypothetical protein
VTHEHELSTVYQVDGGETGSPPRQDPDSTADPRQSRQGCHGCGPRRSGKGRQGGQLVSSDRPGRAGLTMLRDSQDPGRPVEGGGFFSGGRQSPSQRSTPQAHTSTTWHSDPTPLPLWMEKDRGRGRLAISTSPRTLRRVQSRSTGFDISGSGDLSRGSPRDRGSVRRGRGSRVRQRATRRGALPRGTRRAEIEGGPGRGAWVNGTQVQPSASPATEIPRPDPLHVEGGDR